MRRRLTIRRENAISVVYTEGPIELFREGDVVFLTRPDEDIADGHAFSFRAEDVVIEVETL